MFLRHGEEFSVVHHVSRGIWTIHVDVLSKDEEKLIIKNTSPSMCSHISIVLRDAEDDKNKSGI